MVGSATGKPAGIKMVTRFAYAAGGMGIPANLFLIAFYALQASHPEDGTSLGSANDLVGSLGAAFMVPVVLGLSAWLPDRRLSRITLVLGLSALAVGGPLLVLGMLTFDVQAPVAAGAWMVLCRTLSVELVRVVRETMQPEHVSLWLRPDTAPRDRQAD